MIDVNASLTMESRLTYNGPGLDIRGQPKESSPKTVASS